MKLSRFKTNSNITGSLTWLHGILKHNWVLIKLFQSELSHCLTRMPGGLFSPFRKGEVLFLQLYDDKHNYKYEFLPGIQRPLFWRTLCVCQMWKPPFWEVCLMHSSIIIFKIYRSQHLVISQNQAQLDIISLMIFLLGIIILMIIFSFILVGPSMNMPHHGQLSPKPSGE